MQKLKWQRSLRLVWNLKISYEVGEIWKEYEVTTRVMKTEHI